MELLHTVDAETGLVEAEVAAARCARANYALSVQRLTEVDLPADSGTVTSSRRWTNKGRG